MLTFLWLFDFHVLFDALQMKDQFFGICENVSVSYKEEPDFNWSRWGTVS